MWTSFSRIGGSMMIASLLALGGCSAAIPEESCMPPDAVSYTCDALPAGSTGCSGSPEAFGSPAVPDPEAVFPEGCVIELPFCHPYYPSSVATCTCTEHAGGHDWGCPL